MANESELPPPSSSSEPPPVPEPPVMPPSPLEVPDIPSPPPVPEAAASESSPPASAVPPAVSSAFSEVGKDLQGMATEKNLAIFCHLSALIGGVVFSAVGLPVGNILGPLLIWLWKKDTMPMVNEHGKAALNFQITVSILFLACMLTFFLLLPILVAIAVGIAALILTIIATIKASNGELYRYPFSLRLIK